MHSLTIWFSEASTPWKIWTDWEVDSAPHRLQFQRPKKRSQETNQWLVGGDPDDIVHEHCPQPKDHNRPTTTTPIAVPTPLLRQNRPLLSETRLKILPFDGTSEYPERSPLPHRQSRKFNADGECGEEQTVLFCF